MKSESKRIRMKPKKIGSCHCTNGGNDSLRVLVCDFESNFFGKISSKEKNFAKKSLREYASMPL